MESDMDEDDVFRSPQHLSSPQETIPAEDTSVAVSVMHDESDAWSEYDGMRLTPGRTFWVEILPPPWKKNGAPRKKSNTSPASCSSLTSEASEEENEDAEELQEIVGEHRWPDGKTYLYARLRSEIIHKFTRGYLEKYFPELVEEYDELKDADQLERFDPTSSEVRPRDRPTKVSPPPDRVRRSSRRRDRSYSSVASSEETEDNEDNSEADSDTIPRRITRADAKRPQLSPRKTRSRTTRVPTYKESLGSGSEDLNGDQPVITRVKKTRKVHRIRPELGSIRDIDEAFADLDTDDAALYKHYDRCMKCEELPAHFQLEKRRKNKGKKRATSEFEMTEEERLERQGGWVTCLHCCVASHWGCLSAHSRDEINRAFSAKGTTKADPEDSDRDNSSRAKRKFLGAYETTSYVCSACSLPNICITCKEDVSVLPNQTVHETADANEATTDPSQVPSQPSSAVKPESPGARTSAPLLFRCSTCARATHYHHLPPLQEDEDQERHNHETAEEYQEYGWNCKDCHSWTTPVDRIIAWRPYPPNAVEDSLDPGQVPSVKKALPREYLVKWVDRSFRRLEWVPHQFLSARYRSILSNFLKKGPRIALLDVKHRQVVAAMSGKDTQDQLLPYLGDAEDDRGDEEAPIVTPTADPSAEMRIPESWRRVDRILEVLFWRRVQPSKKTKAKSRSTSKRAVVSDEGASEREDTGDAEARQGLIDGVKPEDHLTETYKARARRGPITLQDSNDVVWAYMKWQELPYDEATWDSPPQDEAGGVSFREAFAKFIQARDVRVPTLTFDEARRRDARKTKHFELLQQPEWGQNPGLKLKPFQLEGFTWLYENWHNHQPCILADEMGLGKTVQIVTFIGKLVKELRVFPSLVIVPNSTISNWLREFETWAPGVRVVMYSGGQKSRDIIRDYEMYGNSDKLACHVLLATYEAVTSARDFSPIFKVIPRWEVVVVDEGQRLKSDTNLLFKRLKELNSIHRVLMTGTPINNNIAELFNLMNFLDPDKWNNLDKQKKRFEVLDEELVQELHSMLRPYFLRRVKSEVMRDLPRKHEIIVPITMTALQKEIWKSILHQNPQILSLLAQSAYNAKSKTASKVLVKSNLNNALMQIRKCMQHPYLVDRALEPAGLSNTEAHQRLVDASAKLRLLQLMLPKLKARGNRVLLFSQFVIALDIIEDFLQGEGYKFMRLDGSTPQAQRQRDMDEFNHPDSGHFIYILSTRAGGVGINLWSADVVIIHDVDFNPHQDFQAVARAHRMGQTKPVKVFTLMIKDSAEEKIVHDGKKKLVLDHLIVQKMDDNENTEDVRSVLSYGARALFEDKESETEMNYTSNDLDRLIERAESEASAEVEPKQGETEGGMTFGFAKIWERQQNALQNADALENPKENNVDDNDFWAEVLERTRKEEEAQALTVKSGRGVRRRATKAVDYAEVIAASPQKGAGSDDGRSEYAASDGGSSPPPSPSDEPIRKELTPLVPSVVPQLPAVNGKKRPRSVYSEVEEDAPCRICKKSHASGDCAIRNDAKALLAIEQMIMSKDNKEPPEVKAAAQIAISETFRQLQMPKTSKFKGVNFKKRSLVNDDVKKQGPEPKKAKVSAWVPPTKRTPTNTQLGGPRLFPLVGSTQASGSSPSTVTSRTGAFSKPVVGDPVKTAQRPQQPPSGPRPFPMNGERNVSIRPLMKEAAPVRSPMGSDSQKPKEKGTLPPLRMPTTPSSSSMGIQDGSSQANAGKKTHLGSPESACQVCLRTPFHILKDCEYLKEPKDPQRILKAYRRLKSDDRGNLLAYQLGDVLSRSFPEIAKAEGLTKLPGKTIPEIIEISD